MQEPKNKHIANLFHINLNKADENALCNLNTTIEMFKYWQNVYCTCFHKINFQLITAYSLTISINIIKISIIVRTFICS